MASLVKDSSGNFLVRFRYGRRTDGKLAEFTKSADTKVLAEATAAKTRVEETLKLLRSGWLTLPEGADPGEFIISGGRRSAKPAAAAAVDVAVEHGVTLKGLFASYERDFPAKAKESTTLYTERCHKAHLLRVLGPDLDVSTLTQGNVQRYVNVRSRETWRGASTQPQTILKELGTFRSIWNWAAKLGIISTPVPFCERDLRFNRVEERAPFQTLDVIEATIRRGGVSDEEAATMWERLYLTDEQVGELLEHVRTAARHPFIYPMVVFAAMTGARRSEICRSRLEDWDFASRTVRIREKKRKRGTNSFRNVDLNESVFAVMKEWFVNHPGGQHAISKEGKPLTFKMASNHLKRTLSGSKWAVVPGFHTFRHSFASILASKGADASVIDLYMGHQTQEQRERYRHLYPKNRKAAIELISVLETGGMSR